MFLEDDEENYILRRTCQSSRMVSSGSGYRRGTEANQRLSQKN